MCAVAVFFLRFAWPGSLWDPNHFSFIRGVLSTTVITLKEEEYPPRDDFSDADQLRVGNDGVFMLAFFSK